MDELGDVKQALRLARVDSYNPPIPEAAESADSDDAAQDGATVERIAPEDDPNTTGNSVFGIYDDLERAISDVSARLNACTALIDAEAQAEGDFDVALPGPHVRSIRTMLNRVIDQLTDCALPLARLDRFHIPKRDGEFPTHIIVRGMVTPFQRPLLGAICETAAQLGLPDLQSVHELVERYVVERKAARTGDKPVDKSNGGKLTERGVDHA